MTALQTYRALVQRGALPALTLYGPAAGAPRLELSGAVIANHAAKAANFLADDLMLDPGSQLKLDLPVHWRLITWGLGGLLAGAHLSWDEGDAVVTANPDAEGDEVILVSLGALDLSWPGDLPPGVIDGNAEVLAQADILLDESAGADSNADAFTRTIASPEPRLLLVDPSPADLLGAFIASIAADRTLAVSDERNTDQAVREGAAPLRFGTPPAR